MAIFLGQGQLFPKQKGKEMFSPKLLPKGKNPNNIVTLALYNSLLQIDSALVH